MSNYIFDFDGTLADTLPIFIKLFEASSYGHVLSPADIERYRNMSALDVIRVLGVPLWRLPGLLVNGRKDLARHIDEVHIFPGLAETLAKLKDRGDNLFVVSSNSTANIRRFLRNHQVDEYFTRIYGNSGIFGKAKVIRDIMRKHKLPREASLYIGDETRDIEAARRAHIRVISVSWGYNGAKILKAHQPDFFVDKASKLLTVAE